MTDSEPPDPDEAAVDDAAVEELLSRLSPADGAEGATVSPDAVYDDLCRIARQLFRHESAGRTLQPTALVHEAYLRLANREASPWQSREHFLAAAAVAMRRVLVDAARERASLRRGAALERVTLTGVDPVAPTGDGGLRDWDLLDLEEALQALARHKPRLAQIAELRYFGGLSVQEICGVLGVTKTVIDREWVRARAYLAQQLGSGDPE